MILGERPDAVTSAKTRVFLLKSLCKRTALRTEDSPAGRVARYDYIPQNRRQRHMRLTSFICFSPLTYLI